ncbi:cupin domain-containing protein [Paenarthrobacter ureafaciens]|uniref:cupin domain-containing protein n=1 Tax=Paenarthrobacter ureafaciens TaxID=37931 RepID=UPI002DC04627|nr:cupin domain-containing protein [Paenarthrobacter ureafaciens]MEC3853972.1 cupin domain-containing protein [Paenarthrobacter ureafaciens]
MSVRRVVTGADSEGRSVVISDGVVPHSHDFKSMPGQSQIRIWFTPGNSTGKPPEAEPTDNHGPVVPGPGGASFVIVRYAPDSVVMSPDFDPVAAGQELQTYAPDLAEVFEPNGMHRTCSVDYGIVLDGEVWLELDDGFQVRLTPGDTVVQLAARHAWRNKTEAPATVAFVLTGVDA